MHSEQQILKIFLSGEAKLKRHVLYVSVDVKIILKYFSEKHDVLA
jgi:hypothetical protein